MSSRSVSSHIVQESFDDALRHHEAGRLDEAIAGYSRAIELRPDFPEACYNLGNVFAALGRLDQAAERYARVLALSPHSAHAHNNLGVVRKEQGRSEEAAACFGRATELDPDFPDAHNNLGNLLMAQKRLNEAGACFRRALELDPAFAAAHNNHGTLLMEQGRPEEAAACFAGTIALMPQFPEAHNNLGSAFMELGQLDAAAACCQRALALRRNFPEARYNLGNVRKEQGRLDEAVAAYAEAIEARPDFAGAHHNLGVVLRQQGRLDEAVACYGRAIALDPDPETHNNLAMALLARGDMAAGWKEYEWRWRTPNMLKARRDFAQPQWQGDEAGGRTLLIHAEQGFGDTLQFCRYAGLAAQRGWRVILEVQKPLVRLLDGLPGVDLVLARGEALPHFDLHCPMLSLPLAMATTLATIPGDGPYLRPDQGLTAAMHARLAAGGRQGLRIGLVWAGNPRRHSPALSALDRRRSIAPERLAPLFELPGLHLVSLQKDGPAAPEAFPLTDFMDEMGDFADTAALVAALDLVISVDSAVAHLAAAMGKPVWVLDRFDPCWRWLSGRRDSPWYPTLRLYRQPRPGDWEAVLAEVTHDLVHINVSLDHQAAGTGIA